MDILKALSALPRNKQGFNLIQAPCRLYLDEHEFVTIGFPIGYRHIPVGIFLKFDFRTRDIFESVLQVKHGAGHLSDEGKILSKLAELLATTIERGDPIPTSNDWKGLAFLLQSWVNEIKKVHKF